MGWGKFIGTAGLFGAYVILEDMTLIYLQLIGKMCEKVLTSK